VQEPLQFQIDDLYEDIRHVYNYYGKPRDLKKSEHSGIFFRKDKYIVKEDGYIWFNETRT
jgi:acyl-coenzyme A synthetase/AMP-(fatty) acid ligase